MNEMQSGKVLVIDDDDTIRNVFAGMLRGNGFFPIEASNGNRGLEAFGRERPDTVLLDLLMPGMDGMETMLEIKKHDPHVPIIIVTGNSDIDIAVKAVKSGAYDFIVKPPSFEKLIVVIKRAIEKRELHQTVRRLNTAVGASLEWLLGRSPQIKKVIEQIHQVAASDFSVIIEGETGTGKTYLARAMHNLSRRAEMPFVAVDVGAIPETLIESELFGHEKGAFTGAERKKKGFFESANGGTILIDELQNMSSYVQSKLLGVIEEKRLYPLGSTRSLDIDVRIVAATNSDIRGCVRDRKLREDLFYRLGEFIITLPPLRERADDIPFLAQKFLFEAASELSKNTGELTDGTIELLLKNPWNGNLRELKNVIRRAVLLSGDTVIRPENIEFLIEDDRETLPSFPLREVSAIAARKAETKAISQALRITGWNKTRAASLLQVDYKTLLTKIREYNIGQRPVI